MSGGVRRPAVEADAAAILPDVLEPGLRVVFCGTAAGKASARAGAYYAGPGNAFWPTLHRSILDSVERARATWTDERLDDLSKSVDRIDEDLRQFRTEMNARFDSLEGRLGNRIDGVQAELGGRIDGLQAGLGSRVDGVQAGLGSHIDAVEGRVGARIDGLQGTMARVGGGVIVAVLTAAVNVILTAA